MGVLLSVLMVRVDVPELLGIRVILVGVRDAFGPEGEMITERVKVPLKPFKLVRVTSEDTVEDRARLSVVGLAEMEKSDTMTGIEMLWDRDPLVPVTLAV